MSRSLEEIHDQLVAAVESLVSSEQWRAMLEISARFHNYSSGGITYSNSLNSTGSFMADLMAILLVKTSA